MAINTKTFGIFQGDLIIRSALEQGLATLRSKPWLLDFCFASLAQDDLTNKTYGQSTIDKAKSWFLQQKLPVTINTTNNPPTTFPAISIQLVSSNEDAKTHGDVNYEPFEDNDMQWPDLYGPFDAISYNSTTGILILPDDVQDKLILCAGQLIIDRTGGMHQILEIFSATTIQIDKSLTVDFSQSVIKGQPPALITSVESVVFSETYQIGCHVMAEPEYLTWLHSIIVFVLLAYKQVYLEARNFERSVISSSDFTDNPNLGDGTNAYSRFITLSGYVRQMWPGSIAQKITGTETQIVVEDAGKLFPGATQTELDDQAIIGDEDSGFFK